MAGFSGKQDRKNRKQLSQPDADRTNFKPPGRINRPANTGRI